jgi:dinuclear metal center YbgI/SA1388 family protein
MVIQWLESFAPKSLAVEGDKIGFHIGNMNKEVHHVLVTLDIMEEVVDEAIYKQVDLIIAHHPILYRPLQHIRTDQPFGRLIERLIQHNIAVYSAHTNLDIAEGGVNDWLADKLELQDKEILAATQTEQLIKIVVYVPLEHEQRVRKALGDAGAGHIGRYSHCSFRSTGIGTFMPLEGSQPYIGNSYQLSEVDEIRLETVVPHSIYKKVLAVMLKAHPYEEVAYDIYHLKQEGKQYGLGRVGLLPQEMTLEAFAHFVKERFDVPFCRIVGQPNNLIKKVAILGGDGNKYIYSAIHKGADAFVTGDVYFHTAQDALLAGLSLVDPGHHVEKVMIKGVQEVLLQKAKQNKKKLKISASQVNTEPFKFV